MNQQINGVVSRKQFLRALEATGVSVRHLGGEIVIDLGLSHYRVGARRGVSPVLMRRLVARAQTAGYPINNLLDRLYGKAIKDPECRGQS